MQTSESFDKLTPALIAARKKFKPLIAKETNEFLDTQYADLEATIKSVIDALLENDLLVIQSPEKSETAGTIHIITRLVHSSGQWIESVLPMPVGQGTAQAIGSAITYGRRYSLLAILCIAARDDDGSAASEEGGTTPAQAEQGAEPVKPKKLTADQITEKAKELHTLADVKHGGVDAQKLGEYLKSLGYVVEMGEDNKPVNSWSAAVSQGFYEKLKAWIKENKKA